MSYPIDPGCSALHSVETVLFLVIPATVLAAFARRLRLPAPSLLVIAGVIVGLLPGVADVLRASWQERIEHRHRTPQ